MMKSFLNLLAVLFAVVLLSGCAAFKANKCDRCPEFTQLSQPDVVVKADELLE